MSYLSPSLPLMNSWKASSPVWVGWLVDWLCPMRMISSPLLPEPAQPASPPAARAAIAAMNERRVIFSYASLLLGLPQAAALPPCKKYTPIIPHLYSKRHGHHSPILRTLFVQKDSIFSSCIQFCAFSYKKSSYLHGILLKKRFLSILPGADEKNRASPAKKGGPVFQYAENRRNSYKSYKPDAPGLFGHGHDARPAGGKRAGTKENPELFQMEKLGVSGGRGWIRTTEALSSRFTVCPHWPLGNTPLFCLAGQLVLPDDLFILPQALRFVNSFFEIFRPARCGVLSSLAVFAPAVRPAAPDCLLILAPGARFVNSQFCFCCEIGIY